MMAVNPSELSSIRCYLKRKFLVEKPYLGHEKERNQLTDLIKKTVQFGESNSTLVIGPIASGKSALMHRVLEDLYNSESCMKDCMVVKLHGLVHHDDRLALKSITAQMNLENVVDGKVFGNFADNLSFLLSCLRTGEKNTSKSVIFIIDEFDMFCSHHNQTLLYNLFDISQSAQTPLCIIGMTCRLDVIELLEKRVKSRFSHRQIFLFPGQEFPSRDNTDLEWALSHIDYYLKIPNLTNPKISNSAKKHWNAKIDELLKDKKVIKIIERLVEIDNTELTLKTFLTPIVFNMKDNKWLTIEQFQEQLDEYLSDDMVTTLLDLSILELSLIIAMKHHLDIYGNRPMNFEMILARYLKFANAHANIQSVEKSVIMKAFEHIQDMQLISMVHLNSKTLKEYQYCKLLVTPEQISEAVKHYPQLPSDVIQWASSSVV